MGTDEVSNGALSNQHLSGHPGAMLHGQSPPRHSTDIENNDSHKAISRRRRCFFSKSTSGDPGPPPDGGAVAWLQVVAGHLMCFVTLGLFTSFGVFQSYYEVRLSLAPSDISWIGTTQIFMFFVVGAIAGWISDAGLVHGAVFVGSFLIVFGLFMTSLSVQYYQLFLSQGVCTGLGMGILYMPAFSVPTTYFKDKKSLAVGIITSGAGSGGLVYPAMVQQLLPHIGIVSNCFKMSPWDSTLIPSRFRMDPAMYGPFNACHLCRNKLAPPNTYTTSENRSSGRSESVHRNRICLLYSGFFSDLLERILRVFLCKSLRFETSSLSLMASQD